jgi:hypothetical protein
MIGAVFEEYTFEKEKVARKISGHRLFSDSTNTVKIYVFNTDEDLCYYKESKYDDSNNGDLIGSIEYYFEKGNIIFSKEEEKPFVSDKENYKNGIIKEVANIIERKSDLIDFGE